MREFIKNYVDYTKSKNLHRNLGPQEEDFTDFSNNDYLGMSLNKNSIESGYLAAILYGSGSTGSRLLSGNKKIFEEFENEIAKDIKTESSLIFNSGFIANSSVMSAFSIHDTILIFDKLNHASMYYGTGNTRLIRYKHLDYDQLESILKKHASCKKKVIASETIFGMDGDIANIEILSFLSQKYGAMLHLDEAHATGLYGMEGYGVSTDFSLDPSLTTIMGNFGKSLASSGAYVASNSVIKDYLIQKSKGFIYSTALSPFCIGVAKYNWNTIRSLQKIRQSIFDLSSYFSDELKEMGYNVIGSHTNIVPIVFSDTDKMISIRDGLMKEKIIASAIRRPTSPIPRLRFAINARHKVSDIKFVLNVLKQ